MTIRNPIEWGGSQIMGTARALSSVGHSLHHVQDTIHSPAPIIRHIRISDIADAVRKGFEDFQVYRSDVVMLCVVYAAVGLVLMRFVFRFRPVAAFVPAGVGLCHYRAVRRAGPL